MDIKLRYKKNQKAADKVAAFLTNASDKLLFHIPLYTLGQKMDIRLQEILNIFIQGVYDGVFIMEWIYHCPVCGSVAHETLSIHQAATENFCKACNKFFTNTLDDNIEVCFSIHPSLKVLDAAFKAQYLKEIEVNVNQGNYRTWIHPHVVRGIDIVQNNLYRDLMKSDTLIAGQSLQVMKTAVLFTDIKGSTQLYTDLGDAKAFSLVKDHFTILFDAIKKFDGVPVKTIGDAVMGVFADPKNAFDAALEAQQRLIRQYHDKPDSEKIEIKIGMHTGPALVVTLNNRLDYFGSTVNIASRIQNTALPNEIVISKELFKDRHIKKSILTVTDTVQKQNIKFKGVGRNYTVYHIRMRHK